MVLVSLVLVLVAAVALVIGLLQSGLEIIYVSIGCSVVAGILLAVAVVRGKPEKLPAGLTSQAPPPPPPPPPPSQSWESPQPAPEREPVMAGAGGSAAPDSTQQLDQAAIERAVLGDEDDLPIPDYDRLRATEVLPLLAGLDTDQLAQVRIREAAGRNRFMVLSRIDRELEARGPSDDADSGVAADSHDADSSERDTDDDWEHEVEADAQDDEDADEDADEDEPEERRGTAPVRAAAASGSILDNYEQLKVLEILPRLGDLDADELAQVRRREQAGQRRAMIINRVDRLIADAGPARSARPARPAVAAPARRGPARRASPTKASAKKAVVKKATAKKAVAKKAMAKRVIAKKAAPTKSSAKKAVAKKVAAKRVPAKKAVRTSTPTEKRSGAVRKTTKSAKKR